MISDNLQEHYCGSIKTYPVNKFFQQGSGLGRKILILGESPAPGGWRKSGRAFYTAEGKLIPTGKNLNKLLEPLSLSVEICGFTELVKCYISAQKNLLKKCGKRCWPIFIKQLTIAEPKLIVILGIKTLEIFYQQIHRKIPLGEVSLVQIEGKDYYVLPIYHPSPISPFNQNKNLRIFKTLRRDLRNLLKD